MKKKIFIALALTVLAACLFAIGVFAAEIKIEADSLDDIHTAIAGAQDTDSVVIDLTKDIAIPNTSSAIKVDGAKTVTINFNGYTIYANAGSSTAGTVYGMYVNSNNAKLILNGTWDVDPVNYVAPTDQKISISNGEVNDPNEAAGIKSPDYASNGPSIYIAKGSIELNNMYINQYHTGEWAIFMMGSGDHVHNVKISNSIVRVPDSNSLLAVGRRDAGGTFKQSLTQIEDSVIYGLGGGKESVSFSEGSYIRNTRIAKHKAYFDSYLASDACPKEPIDIENVIFENKNIYFWTGRYSLNFIDCTFPENYSIEINGDREGNAKITMTETATCEKVGRQAYSEAVQGKAEYITSFDSLETVVEQYSIDNPALGHNITAETATGVTWENYFENGAYEGVCARCSIATAETTPSADPLFVNRGFSYAQYPDTTRSMTQLFKVNKEMTKYLENGYDFGVVAMLNEGGNEVSPLDSANVVSASFNELGYDYFDIKVTNIPLANEKTPIVFCAYLVNDGKAYYLNDGTTANLVSGLTYEAVSKK